MTETNNGGPAFPGCVRNSAKKLTRHPGMTLRDYFAGQALTGIMGPNYDWFTSGTEKGSRTHEAASFAYSLADAMIAAREGGDA